MSPTPYAASMHENRTAVSVTEAPAPDAALHLLRSILARERAHVSTVLHNEVGQLLTAAGLELELARIDALGLPDGEIASQIAAAAARMDEAFARVRTLSYETHPDPVNKFGFAAAIEQFLSHAKARYPRRLRTRLDRSAEPRINLAPAIYEIVTTTLDIALQPIYSSQVSFSTHEKSGSVYFRIRWAPGPNSTLGEQYDQNNTLEGIRQIAVSCGVPCTVFLDRSCASIVELHG